MDTQDFGAILKARRTEKRIPLRRFSELVEIDSATLSKYERGRMAPPQNDDALGRIARALDLEKDSDEWRELHDAAAIQNGLIPSDLTEPEIVAKLPALRPRQKRSQLLRAVTAFPKTGNPATPLIATACKRGDSTFRKAVTRDRGGRVRKIPQVTSDR